MGQSLATFALRSVLGLGFAGSLGLQTFVLPFLADETARENPEVAHLRWPVLIAAILWLGSTQVILLGVWKLLAACRRNRIFTPDSCRWVDRIIVALAAGCLLSGAFTGFDLATAIGPLSVPLAGLTACAGGVGLLSLMVVLRGLLRQATDLQLEMAAVV